jgi:uncharacterized protein YceK
VLFSLALAIGHMYFQDQTCGEVLSAVPYINGFIFFFVVFHIIFLVISCCLKVVQTVDESPADGSASRWFSFTGMSGLWSRLSTVVDLPISLIFDVLVSS